MAVTQIPSGVDPLRSFGDSTNAQSLKEVRFTKQQLAYLEQQFPEPVQAGALSDAQLRERVGQRSVVAHVRGRTC